MKSVVEISEIQSNKQIAAGFYDLRVHAPDIVDLAVPGQFVHIRCGERPLRRPISICGLDKQEGILRMVYEVRGEGTEWMSQRGSGETLDILGPLGQGFKLADNHKRVVVVGGGLGVPPLIPVAQQAGKSTVAVLGFRAESAAILLDDFADVCGSVMLSSNDGTLGRKGFVTDDVRALCERGEVDLICACGPTPMLKAVAEVAAEYGVDAQVSLEQRMGCGIGACLVCSCKADMGAGETYAQVCRNGPVFKAEEVVW